MSDTPASVPAISASPKKAPKVVKVAKPKTIATKPSHPPTAEMVLAAITNLKERNGSSLQAIKKYIVSTYKLDTDKQGPYVKKYLVKAVDAGTLVRTKGKGASGSFKLSKVKSEKIAKAPKKVAVAKKPAASSKKVTSGEKAAVANKKPAPKKAAVAKPAANKTTVAKPAAKKTSAKPAAAPKTKKSIAKKSAKSPATPKAPKAKKQAKVSPKKK